MPTLLITGATGRVGGAAACALADAERDDLRILRTTRHRDRVGEERPYFDYADSAEAAAAFAGVDGAFLMIPPGLGEVSEAFTQLGAAALEAGVRHVVLLSVQGAESSPYLPHARAERALRDSGVPCTFIRPSYFMQNLSDVFGEGIRERRELRVPAGAAKFRWVDADDVGRATAAALLTPDRHTGKAYTVTGAGADLLGFARVAELLSAELGTPVDYVSPGPLGYAVGEIRRGSSVGLALVQTLLHYGKRFSADPPASPDYTYLTGVQPVRLKAFIARERSSFA